MKADYKRDLNETEVTPVNKLPCLNPKRLKREIGSPRHNIDNSSPSKANDFSDFSKATLGKQKRRVYRKKTSRDACLSHTRDPSLTFPDETTYEEIRNLKIKLNKLAHRQYVSSGAYRELCNLLHTWFTFLKYPQIGL